jgi:translation elongation factor EF-G
MTGGRASFEMEFSHYEQVPQHITQKVVTEAQAAAKKT